MIDDQNDLGIPIHHARNAVYAYHYAFPPS